MRVYQKLQNALDRAGSVKLAAEALNMHPTKFRASLTSSLEKNGKSAEHVRVRESIAVINQYAQKTFTKMREMIGNPAYVYGVAVCHIGDKLHCVREDKATGEIVGVYDRESDPDDMRADLYWYVTNYMMETKQ